MSRKQRVHRSIKMSNRLHLLTLEESDHSLTLDPPTPPTTYKKRDKMKTRRNRNTRNTDFVVGDSDNTGEDTMHHLKPRKECMKKKRKTKRSKHRCEKLGVTIIPDCEDQFRLDIEREQPFNVWAQESFNTEVTFFEDSFAPEVAFPLEDDGSLSDITVSEEFVTGTTRKSQRSKSQSSSPTRSKWRKRKEKSKEKRKPKSERALRTVMRDSFERRKRDDAGCYLPAVLRKSKRELRE